MAKARAWSRRIKEAATKAGTYKDCFDSVIDILADIMERRDEALAIYKKSGEGAIVPHTNKAGAENMERNPALLLVADCEKMALQYWRDLGLTPAGLKRINEELTKEKELSPLEEILGKLEVVD